MLIQDDGEVNVEYLTMLNISLRMGASPISAKITPTTPVFGIVSACSKDESKTFSTSNVLILALMGDSP